MNKKQLIVAWVMGVLICILVLYAPKVYLEPFPYGGYRVEKVPTSETITKIQWDFVLQRSLIILIIGSLLIYTLRDKKK